jgi:hypothetical protein
MKRTLMTAVAAILLAFFASTGAQAISLTLVGTNYDGLTGGDKIHTTQYTQPYNWGFNVYHSFGSFNSGFEDTYNFHNQGDSGLSFAVTTFNHVLDMTLTLLDKGGHVLYSSDNDASINFGDVFETANGQTNITTIKYTFTGALLAAVMSQAGADLTMKITGAFCHCAGYSITVTPIPASLIMLLTALGGMGVVGWMRRNRGSSHSAQA